MTSSAMSERHITFQSKGQPAFPLEGVVHLPAKLEQAPIIILCHPQPARSDMQDPLTVALAKRLAQEEANRLLAARKREAEALALQRDKEKSAKEYRDEQIRLQIKDRKILREQTLLEGKKRRLTHFCFEVH